MRIKIDSLPIRGEVTIQRVIWGKSDLLQVSLQDRGRTGIIEFSNNGEILTAVGVYEDVLVPLVNYIGEHFDSIRDELGIKSTKPVIKDITPMVSRSKYLGKHRALRTYDAYYRDDIGELYLVSDAYTASISTRTTDIHATMELSDTEVRLLLTLKNMLMYFNTEIEEVEDNLTFEYRPTDRGIKFIVYRNNTYCAYNVDCTVSKDCISVLTFGSFMLKELNLFKDYLEKSLSSIKSSNMSQLLKGV